MFPGRSEDTRKDIVHDRAFFFIMELYESTKLACTVFCESYLEISPSPFSLCTMGDTCPFSYYSVLAVSVKQARETSFAKPTNGGERILSKVSGSVLVLAASDVQYRNRLWLGLKKSIPLSLFTSDCNQI